MIILFVIGRTLKGKTCYSAAAEKLSRRHSDGSLPSEDYHIELENQAGEKIMLGTETDQR